MGILIKNRMILAPVRYLNWRKWNWVLISIIILSVGGTAFIIWCMAKEVR